ncbi:MAG TPA: RCC1 repeat-containing protein, partial [Anaerolineae bacterium]|nr:RCC1 repeat-containing protein [Anaerolineae bacterium]
MSAIHTSYNTVCAATTAGVAKCWGDNFWGQVGSGSFAFSILSPVTVTGLISGVVSVAAGDGHSCALMASGGVKCWGSGSQGELGNLNDNDSPVPVDVYDLNNAQTISAGRGFTCVRLTTGGAKCWGRNLEGMLGDGTQLELYRPRTVVGLNNAIKVDAGGTHTCAMSVDHTVRCWGNNNLGQLGIGIPPARPAPVDVIGLTGVQKVVGGGGFSCALLTGGHVSCWGSNWYGTLGYQPDLGFPYSPPIGGDTWGLSPLPVPITQVTGITDLAAGTYHVCVLNTAGGVQCWGQGREGQLGVGYFNTSSTSPVTPTGLVTGVVSIAGAYSETCAVMQTGGVKCWGNYQQSSPTDMAGISNAQTVAMGDQHHCVLTIGGGVKCWGANNYGQNGDGTLTPRSSPTDVVGLTSGVTQIASGSNHVCALTTGGGVKCWGQNGF